MIKKYQLIGAVTLMGLLPLGVSAADPVYTTAAPANSGCKVYDVSNIIGSIDTDHDGRMTRAEWQRAKAPPSSFKMLDKGKKGYVTIAEFLATAPPPGVDTNKDCRITLAEMQAMDKNMAKPAK